MTDLTRYAHRLHHAVGNRVMQRLLAARAPGGGDPAAVQRAVAGLREPSDDDVRAAAVEGLRTPGGPMPFLDRIQASFGRHPVSHVTAHAGEKASRAAGAMGALAFASGSHVVFGREPDLHTAAHEAAHVVQQQAGVQLSGGIGREGDAYERNADAVADAVVASRSAEELLDAVGTAAAPSSRQSLQLVRLEDPEAARWSGVIRDVLELREGEFSFVMDGDEIRAGPGNCHGYTFTGDPTVSRGMDTNAFLANYDNQGKPPVTVFFLGGALAHSARGNGPHCEHKVQIDGDGPVITASAAAVGRAYDACFQLPGDEDRLEEFARARSASGSDSGYDSDDVAFAPRRFTDLSELP